MPSPILYLALPQGHRANRLRLGSLRTPMSLVAVEDPILGHLQAQGGWGGSERLANGADDDGERADNDGNTGTVKG